MKTTVSPKVTTLQLHTWKIFCWVFWGFFHWFEAQLQKCTAVKKKKNESSGAFFLSRHATVILQFIHHYRQPVSHYN